MEGAGAPEQTSVDTTHVTLAEEEKVKLNEGKDSGYTQSKYVTKYKILF